MRIGVDARLMYHRPAGISRYTWHLLQALAKHDKDDEFVVFQHRNHTNLIVKQPNFKRSTVFAPAHGRLEQAMLPLETARFSLDLIHSTDFIPALRSSTPAVITVHDLAFLHWPHLVTKTSARYYGQIDRAVQHAKRIIVPSESTKADLIGLFGVRDGDVSVIYEAADPCFKPMAIEPARQYVAKRFGIPQSYIFFVSTIEPRKNVNGLLQAYRILLDQYNTRDAALVLAGSEGWLYEETMALVAELGLEENTFFLGRVTDEELHNLYVGARCHIHPALYEGFGLPPLEAMACGTPTIVSNVSSLPEVVNDAALLVRPDDHEEIAVALHRLLTDADLHTELSRKGLQQAALFSWDKAALSTLNVYQQVVETNRKVERAVSSERPASGQQANP